MWLPGAQLSVRYRSFQLAEAASAISRTARELAQELVESRGGQQQRERCISFIRDLHKCAHVDQFGLGELPQPELSIEQGGVLTWTGEGSFLAELGVPAPYGVKGGAAREIVAQVMGLRAARPSRDIDLVRRGHHAVKDDEAVARIWMGRDYLLGARVELVRSVDRHLSSRDLTVNEVVVFQDRGHASLLGVLDAVGQVLRPSRYRGGTLHRQPSLHGQSLLKMVRLFAEGASGGEFWRIVGIPEEVSFSDFDLALHLNKAFQRGHEVAELFLVTCEQLGLIPSSIEPITTVLHELEYLRHGTQGAFPDVPQEVWRAAGIGEAEL
jgi:hypothetical protein